MKQTCVYFAGVPGDLNNRRLPSSKADGPILPLQRLRSYQSPSFVANPVTDLDLDWRPAGPQPLHLPRFLTDLPISRLHRQRDARLQINTRPASAWHLTCLTDVILKLGLPHNFQSITDASIPNMPPFRNPFSTRKPASANGLEPGNDENVRPLSNDATGADGQATKPSVALSIKGNRDEPNEFKLSGKSLIRQSAIWAH
jgi:hypothetical protein